MRSKILQLLPAVFLAIGLLLASFVHLHFINQIPGKHGLRSINSDLLPRWVGIRAAFRGEDPYSPAVLRNIQTAFYGRPLTLADRGVDIQGFWYPAYAAVILSPFALLPWSAAPLAFLVVVPLLFIVALRLCIGAFESSRKVAWIATLSITVSWPVMWALRLQQPTVLTAAFVFLAYFLIVRGHDIAAGLLLVASMIKPQLVAPLILWLLLWAVLQRRYRLLASFLCAMTALLIPTEILIPNWFPHWIHSVAGYAENTGSALPLIAAAGRIAGLVATTILVSLSASVLWRLRSSNPQSPQFGFAFSLLLATALCVTPTNLGMTYNQMLLAPAAVLLFWWKPARNNARLVRRGMIGVFAWVFVAVLVSFAGDMLRPSNLWIKLPFENLLLPVAATVALLVQYWDALQTTSSVHRDEYVAAPA